MQNWEKLNGGRILSYTTLFYISILFPTLPSFNLRHSTISTIFYDSVQPFGIVWLGKTWRPNFLERKWTSIFLKSHTVILLYCKVFKGCRNTKYPTWPSINIIVYNMHWVPSALHYKFKSNFRYSTTVWHFVFWKIWLQFVSKHRMS